MKIRSPKNGYNFDSKDKYRYDVWKFFRDNIGVDSKILFFPSKEGLEIPIALRMGFKEENLIAVDGDSAAMSVSKWRKDYPNIKFYGGKLSTVIKRMSKDNIVISAANLDFCNNLSHELLGEFNSFVTSGLLSERCFLSLTVMNGRESRSTNTVADLFLQTVSRGRRYNRDMANFDNKRLLVTILNSEGSLNLIDRYIRFHKETSYLSGKVRMSYGLFEIASKDIIDCIISTYHRKAFVWKEKYVIDIADKLEKLLKDNPLVSYIDADTRKCIILHDNIINKCLSDCGTYGLFQQYTSKMAGMYNYIDKHIIRDEFYNVVIGSHLLGRKVLLKRLYALTRDDVINSIKEEIELNGCYNY